MATGRIGVADDAVTDDADDAVTDDADDAVTDDADDAVTDGAVTDDADDAAARLSAVIGQLVRVLRREAPSEVGPGSLAALATLARSGPLRLGDLAAREGVAPPTLTRMVAALEDAGHVTRRPDVHDRRAVLVSVTDAGARLVADTISARALVLRARLAALPEPDVRALLAALPALEQLVGDETR
jgi:DNA-binding MarR family transcriptional regulator